MTYFVFDFQAFPSGHAVVDVAAGLRHSLAVTKDGRVWSWGSGVKGQLGRFDPQTQAGADVHAVPEKSEQPQPGKKPGTGCFNSFVFHLP